MRTRAWFSHLCGTQKCLINKILRKHKGKLVTPVYMRNVNGSIAKDHKRKGRQKYNERKYFQHRFMERSYTLVIFTQNSNICKIS